MREILILLFLLHFSLLRKDVIVTRPYYYLYNDVDMGITDASIDTYFLHRTWDWPLDLTMRIISVFVSLLS